MFINSGMAPLKPYFTGQAKPPSPRLTNVQDCIRFVDVESVGDSDHGTNFRMMGSWSFGDHFKERAIELAFELITEGFGIPADPLPLLVFMADESLPGVPSDEESARIWEKFLPRDRSSADRQSIISGVQPEPVVHVDHAPKSFLIEARNSPRKKLTMCLVPGRHIEIWNAGVFMQYFKDEQGNFSASHEVCGYRRWARAFRNDSSGSCFDTRDRSV